MSEKLPIADVLVLESTDASNGRWPPADYNVRRGAKIIGRIMLWYYAPLASPWAWSINAIERKGRPSEECQGFAVDPESAMDAFCAAWTRLQSADNAPVESNLTAQPP